MCISFIYFFNGLAVYKVTLSFHSLQKSHLEKEDLEGELKDLQDSLLAKKKQTSASDDNRSLAEVIQQRLCSVCG